MEVSYQQAADLEKAREAIAKLGYDEVLLRPAVRIEGPAKLGYKRHIS